MKQKLLSSIVGLAVAGTMLMPSLGMAETGTSTATANMLVQIQALQAQIQALKAAQTQVASTSATISATLLQMRNLRQGMSGDDVKALQAILASDPSIYSGEITGFFGKLTGEALKKYQKKFGLEAVGFVGPKTLKKLSEHGNELGLSNEGGSATSTENRKDGDKKLCVKVAPGHMIAPGWLKKNGDKPVVPECQTLPKGISDKMNDWNHGSTTESYTYPMINTITASTTATTTATVIWTSNKPTVSSFYYGTVNPLTISAATKISNTVASTTQAVNLSGLTASTTYYYVVTVSDSKNTATSTQRSFTTPAL